MASARRPAYISGVTSKLYTRDILRLAASIPCLGRLEKADASAERRSPVCGSEIVVDIRIDARGRVEALGQEIRACALGQASAAIMGRHALGQDRATLERARASLAAFLSGEIDEPGEWSALGVFTPARDYPARHAAIMLPFDAMLGALESIARDAS